MTNIINRRKKGISTVLTTLIIVVASVVLGTAVTLFGTSLFQTGAQNTNMAVQSQNLWINPDVDAGAPVRPLVEGAFAVRNTGDKLIAVDKIQVRGAIVPFAQWYASDPATTTAAMIQSQLLYDTEVAVADLASLPASITITAAGSNVTLTKQTGPVSLDPGKSTIIFHVAPGSLDTDTSNDIITSADVGAAATVAVSAGAISSVQAVTVAKV
jgi:hypothetical protein